MNKKSKVYLVGAGPGRIDLITVRGLELLKSADCVIYDKLASPGLLKYARLDDFQTGGTLGQAAFTFDYIFGRGRIGAFGTKGFLNEAVVGRNAISRNVFDERYLRVVDQIGGSTAVTLFGNEFLCPMAKNHRTFQNK